MLEKLNVFNKEELDYINNSEYKFDYPGLKEAMETPRFTIKDLCITARDATYWDKKEILPIIKGINTTRRKYTLKQAVWIKLIQQLRSFDISLSQIKKIKEHLLMEKLNIRELMKSEQMILVMKHFAEKEGRTVEEFNKIINDPSFLKEMENEHLDVFEIMIIYAIIFRRDVSYIVTVDGQSFPYVYDKHELMKKAIPKFELLMKSPHIVLSLSQAYSQLIQNWNEKRWFNEVSIVSTDEKKILKLIRDESIKELTIMKNDHVADRVIIVQDRPLIAVEAFANHIVRNGYQTITISTRQGKPVHYKNEVSIKLKNIPEEPDN